MALGQNERQPLWEDFQVDREDELTEMVWALQAAGRVFQLQEEEKVRRLQRALLYGVLAITDCANQLQVDLASNRKFVLLAIDHYLCEAPSDNDDLMANLYALREFCDQSNTLLELSRTKERDAELSQKLGKTLELCIKIKGALGKV